MASVCRPLVSLASLATGAHVLPFVVSRPIAHSSRRSVSCLLLGRCGGRKWLVRFTTRPMPDERIFRRSRRRFSRVVQTTSYVAPEAVGNATAHQFLPRLLSFGLRCTLYARESERLVARMGCSWRPTWIVRAIDQSVRGHDGNIERQSHSGAGGGRPEVTADRLGSYFLPVCLVVFVTRTSD